eukprot:maker-scaffold_89-snap-gene-0.9-mRNA-1 protein AED:0.16 eAED:0.16 QI:0/0/0/1/1/1/2/0/359
MGNSLPIPDDQLQEAMNRLQLTKPEISRVWKVFQKYDKDSSGSIDIKEFYLLIDEEKSVFGDAVFELVDVDHNGHLEFGEFVLCITKYCLLGKQDVLKFCFNIFDKDKSGFIDQTELSELTHLLHGKDMKANVKVALEKIDEMIQDDGKIEFHEFEQIHAQFPMLLFPSFRIQENMMDATFGQSWWRNKKEQLAMSKGLDEKMEEKRRLAKLRREKHKRLRRLQNRMGICKFYCCFLQRSKYASILAEEDAIRESRRKKRMEEKKTIQRQLTQQKSLAKVYNTTTPSSNTQPRNSPQESNSALLTQAEKYLKKASILHMKPEDATEEWLEEQRKEHQQRSRERKAETERVARELNIQLS